jgi:hypothetical protein
MPAMTMANKPGSRLRGYNGHHAAVRKLVKPMVDRGEAICNRCGRPIPPGGEGTCPGILASGRVCLKNHHTWHLDHADDRVSYRGPAHLCCNVGKATQPARRKTNQVGTFFSRAW